MAFFLKNGVSYGRTPEATVVLDLRRDRYFRLGIGAAAALAKLERDLTVADCDFAGLAALVDAGLIDDIPGAPISAVSPTRPDLSALEVLPVLGSEIGLARIAFANFRVRHFLKRRGLAATVEWLRAMRASASLSDDPNAAVAIAQRYSRLRRAIPGKPVCVPEACTLALLLIAERIAHDVVFGVSLTPFAAHAWTQCDSHILSDRADPIRAFHPVFVL